MTLLAQVQIWRKGIEELTHVSAAADVPQPEIGWITFEGKDDEVVVAGFAADGSTYTVRGKLKELTTKPKIEKPQKELQPIPVLKESPPSPSGSFTPSPSPSPAPPPFAPQQPAAQVDPNG